MQHTISGAPPVEGVGIHSGEPCRVVIGPGAPDSGIIFRRRTINGETTVPATVEAVTDTARSTTVGMNGARVRTVEHLLAALFALGVDNAEVTVSGEELPALDGSARDWVSILNHGKRIPQDHPRKVLPVQALVRVEDGDRYVEVRPSERLEITYTIDFPGSPIGRQERHFVVTPERFAAEIAPARTYGFLEEVETLRDRRLGLGGNRDNCVVVTKDGYLTTLRFPDEMVRHKILDFLGDLGLLGREVRGHFTAHKANHGLHVRLLKELDGLR